ncbi:hypothetical protein Acr_04g0000590 [Actinidia rufa]|uniref:Uncharacterized protein n=1 Tax=Actinidia rufa TaxID=165716 RepID=A0A7J0EFT7_9ERIC|nr:hypothetical protein Acr_04g0000590 [Actinidia rufa]
MDDGILLDFGVFQLRVGSRIPTSGITNWVGAQIITHKDDGKREGYVKALKSKSEKPANLRDDEWQEKRALANSTIQLYLGNKTLGEVINETDQVELWAKLKSSKLYGPLGRVQKVINELDVIDVKIEEEDKAILLLVSLPRSYEHLRTTLMYGQDTLKLDEGGQLRGRVDSSRRGVCSQGVIRGSAIIVTEGHAIIDCSKMNADKAKKKSEHAVVIEYFTTNEDDVLTVSSGLQGRPGYTASKKVVRNGTHNERTKAWVSGLEDVQILARKRATIGSSRGSSKQRDRDDCQGKAHAWEESLFHTKFAVISPIVHKGRRDGAMSICKVSLWGTPWRGCGHAREQVHDNHPTWVRR